MLLDESSDKKFYDYYAKASQSDETTQRFLRIQRVILRVLEGFGQPQGVLEVADIGCGAGTQSIIWAELGHHVQGIDINESLINLAKERAGNGGLSITFRVGGAEALPWPNDSMDVCLVPELLEHVPDWKSCIDEFTRVLRPGGILFLTTSNKLCPIQQEFNLPLYSWYPASLKRYFVRLATTKRPELANFAKYPAVNWFSFYDLRKELQGKGFKSFDHFDVMDTSEKGVLKNLIVSSIRTNRLLRFFAHGMTPYTMIFAIKTE